MTYSTHQTSACSSLLGGKEKCLKTMEMMYLTRFSDEKMNKLVRQNKGGTFHLSVMGHEMTGVVCGLALQPGKDWGLPYYRDRAFAIALGCSVTDIIGACLARAVPYHSRGRMMPEHFSQKNLRIPCQSSCVGSQFLQAVGVAKAVHLLGRDEVVYVSAGEGATSQGDFHEAINFACLHSLSVIFVIQDNGWAISVPVRDQTAGGTISKMAEGYEGLLVRDVDGCNYEQVSKAMSEAVAKGRARQGPSLIVAKVPRIGPHSSSDDPTKYKDKECIQEDKEKDPIPRFEQWLLDMGLIHSTELEELKERCFRQIEAAAVDAERIPFPEAQSATSRVFKEVDSPIHTTEDNAPENSGATDSIVIMDALNHALDEEMKRDSSVIVFGQDVAQGKGGVFGITRNLTAKYGSKRCFNSPLAESSIIGIALGMSVSGYKPVVEIQFTDYMWTGVNQLFNELASFYYRSDGEWNCPVVIRMPYGGYIQGGPYHSQSNEAYLAHCPGLKVVVPSNAADAKKLLKAAIRDPNPVVFLEHKALYRQRVFCARQEPEAEDLLPLGKAKVVRSGTDVTVVCWGMTAFMSVQAADALNQEGISVEVIDLRTLVPLDIDTIIQSVQKTGKLLVAQEAVRTCGFAAEISSRVVEEAFAYLDAPVIRVTGKDCPVPYCKQLEEAVLPQLTDIERAIRDLAHF